MLNAGYEWYPEASRVCADIAKETDHLFDTVCDVVAAFSPRLHWSRNIKVARMFLEGQHYDRPAGTLGRSYDRALGAVTHGYIRGNGRKVANFARNLQRDLTSVTVDVWTARALGCGDLPMSNNLYSKLETAIRLAAEACHCYPAELQAILWCHQKQQTPRWTGGTA